MLCSKIIQSQRHLLSKIYTYVILSFAIWFDDQASVSAHFVFLLKLHFIFTVLPTSVELCLASLNLGTEVIKYLCKIFVSEVVFKATCQANYCKKQNLRHHFYLPKVIIQVQNGNGVLLQASSMHLRNGTSLLSTPLPFWVCIITLGSKNDDEELCCF